MNNIRDYMALFDGVGHQTAIGEASTSYLYCPLAPERIQPSLRRTVPSPIRKASRRSALENAPPIPADAERYLQTAYQEDIRKLEAVVERDLSHWLRPRADIA